MRKLGVFLALFLFIPCFAHGQELAVNGSFEQGTDPGATFFEITAPDSTTIPGWDVVTNSIDYIGGFWQAAEGVRSLDMNGAGPGVIEQQLSTSVGTQYTVTFALAGNFFCDPVIKNLRVSATGNAFQDYTFDTTEIHGKSTMTDAVANLKADSKNDYTLGAVATDLDASSSADVQVIVGKE